MLIFKPLESLLNARPSATTLKYSWKSGPPFRGAYTIRVDSRSLYVEDNSIKAATQSKRAAKKPIRKLVEWQHIPLPSFWSPFIGLDENKTYLAKFLPLGKNLAAGRSGRNACIVSYKHNGLEKRVWLSTCNLDEAASLFSWLFPTSDLWL